MSWGKFLPFAVLLLAAITLSAQTAAIDPSVLAGLTRLEGDGVGTFNASGSTHTSTGVAKGDVFGIASFTASFRDDPSSFSGNGSGGSCFRGGGSLFFTTGTGNSVTIRQPRLTSDPPT